MKPHIRFYFDYVSPYSYFGWLKLKALCARTQWELEPIPVVLGALLTHWETLGPAEIPPKREFVIRDCMRKAVAMGLSFDFPVQHPFNSLTALRLSLPEVAGSDQRRVIDALWEACWVRGEDLGSKETLKKALDGIGLPGDRLLERTADPKIKELLKGRVEEALRRGIFGVPSFVVGDEVFWGQDQMEVLEAFVLGKDSIDRELYKQFVARPRGIDRNVSKKS